MRLVAELPGEITLVGRFLSDIGNGRGVSPLESSGQDHQNSGR